MTEPAKVKKKSIPKVVKDLAWNKWVGEDVAKTKCMCCGVNEIRMSSFHCGHVIADSNGGKPTVDNLRPICSACNLSMGTENMDDFKNKCGFEKVTSNIEKEKEKEKEEVVFWAPGMFDGLAKIPKYVKWQIGTNSIQMGAELGQRGYIYNSETTTYERM